ncbi:hypothetical protein DINM_022519 [Dirofilaria immitis]|nr:hypothetical protein [Dirofilaria immitis]
MDQLDVKKYAPLQTKVSLLRAKMMEFLLILILLLSESPVKQRKMDDEKVVVFDDNDGKQQKHTKHELRVEHAAKYQRDRMGMVLPDSVQDRERERNFVHLATKFIFHSNRFHLAFTLSTSQQHFSSKCSRLLIAVELILIWLTKDETDNAKEDWLSDNKAAIKSETEDDTSAIKSEPESDSE